MLFQAKKKKKAKNMKIIYLLEKERKNSPKIIIKYMKGKGREAQMRNTAQRKPKSKKMTDF